MQHEQICPTCLSFMYHAKLEGWLKCPACSFMKKKGTSMISANEVLMGRIKVEELSDELKLNLADLLIKLNKFRAEYGIPMIVSSGYRPASVNANTPGASKTSAHMTCQACDFADPNGEIKEFIAKDPTILIRCDLYMEHPDSTPGWCHLSNRAPKSGNRIFKP